jgi:hypothetical protein
MNRFFLVVMATALVFMAILSVTEIDFSTPDDMLAIVQNFGILMMLYNGTFRTSKLFQFALFAIGLMLVGAIFKIMHLNGADEMIALSSLGILVPYAIHFIRKPSKQRLDYLKMLLVAYYAVLPPISILHLLPKETVENLRFVLTALFAVTFIDFLYTLRKERKLFT